MVDMNKGNVDQSVYNLITARGGKHDNDIRGVLESLKDDFAKRKIINIRLSQEAKYKGRDRVEIINNSAVFYGQRDHTWAPVATKAAVRMLHSLGFRGLFIIETSTWEVTINWLSE